MSKHVCLVPNEWSKYYTPDVLETILKQNMSCDSISKKQEGKKINVNSVTGQLRYHGDQPWLRKMQDKRTLPNPKEYFGVYMSCNDCRKPASCYTTSMVTRNHQLICWVPREWLAFPWNSLQVVLLKEMSLQFYRRGTFKGTAICMECTTAYLRYHAQDLWMCKDGHDGQKAPCFKEYYAFFIPCVYCANLNQPIRK